VITPISYLGIGSMLYSNFVFYKV